MLTIELPKEIEERLEALSMKTGKPKAVFVRSAILDSIDRIEVAYLLKKDAEDIRSGKADAISDDDLAS